jgi:hypothetical protein
VHPLSLWTFVDRRTAVPELVTYIHPSIRVHTTQADEVRRG